VTTPALVAQPDAEAHAWAQLASIPGVTSFCYAAVSPWPNWLVTYSIQVDARAATKQAARDRADQARLKMLGLPAVPWPEGVCCAVNQVEGPFWLPDNDAGPRYCARYEVLCHPPQAAP